MTDARLPERWLNDRRLLRLSDAGYRLHLTALMWSVGNRTDGALDADDVALLPAVSTASIDELLRAGLWQTHGACWQILDFASTQTSRDDLEVLENQRRREREKKARQRKAEQTGTVPGEVTPGLSPGTPLGQDRPEPGQDEEELPRVRSREPDLPAEPPTLRVVDPPADGRSRWTSTRKVQPCVCCGQGARLALDGDPTHPACRADVPIDLPERVSA